MPEDSKRDVLIFVNPPKKLEIQCPRCGGYSVPPGLAAHIDCEQKRYVNSCTVRQHEIDKPICANCGKPRERYHQL